MMNLLCDSAKEKSHLESRWLSCLVGQVGLEPTTKGLCVCSNRLSYRPKNILNQRDNMNADLRLNQSVN